MTAKSVRRTTRPRRGTQRDREAQLRLAIQASNVGLWDWDIAGGSVYFSPEWKAQLGYLDEELPNRFEEWESRLHPSPQLLSPPSGFHSALSLPFILHLDTRRADRIR